MNKRNFELENKIKPNNYKLQNRKTNAISNSIDKPVNLIAYF